MCDVCLVTSGVAPSYILTVHNIVDNNNLANAMHAQSGAERISVLESLKAKAVAPPFRTTAKARLQD